MNPNEHVLSGALTERARDGAGLAFGLTLCRELEDALTGFLESPETVRPPFAPLLQSILAFTGGSYALMARVAHDSPSPSFVVVAEAERGGQPVPRETKGVMDAIHPAIRNVIATGLPRLANGAFVPRETFGLPAGKSPFTSYLVFPLATRSDVRGVLAIFKGGGDFDPSMTVVLDPVVRVLTRVLLAQWIIDRQRKAEGAVAESDEWRRRVANATMDAHYEWTVATDEVWASPSFVAFFGSPTVSNDGGWWRARVHPSDIAAVECSMQESIARHATNWRAEYRVRLDNGEYAHVLDRGLILYADDGKPVRLIGSLLDVTERHRTAALLQERADAMSVLAKSAVETERRVRAEVAELLHDEVQQLLVAAKLKLAIAQADVAAGPSRVHEALQLLDQALVASRTLSSQLSPPVLRHGDLNAAFAWLGDWMRQRHGLDVDIHGSIDAELSAGEKDALFVITRELLFNIVKHAAVSDATVELASGGGFVMIAVVDHGRGFDTEAASKDGSGLHRIRERVRLLAGNLEVVSQVDSGTRISIQVPIATTPEAPPVADGQRGREPIRVLLADDHAVLRDAMASMLERDPWVKVIGEATNGKEAVHAAREMKPDVIIMDASMPEMDGIEATRAILEEHPNIRVIGLSMHDEVAVGALMKEAGAHAYLNKDAPSSVLLATIHEAGRRVTRAPSPP